MASEDNFEHLGDLDHSDLVPLQPNYVMDFGLSAMDMDAAELRANHSALSALMTCNEPQIVIARQPPPYFEYSFESEVGKLKSKIVLVSLKFQNFDPNTDYVVMCQLCGASMNGNLSPHQIFENKPVSRSIYNKPHLKKMCHDVNESTVTFELCIVQTKDNDKIKALQAKYKELYKLLGIKEDTINNSAQIIANAKANNDILCFSFTVYINGEIIMQPITKPVYSNIILNEVLKLLKIINAKGCYNESTKVTLHLKHAIQSEIKVRFYENKLGWEGFGEHIAMKDFKLTCDAPIYDGTWPDDERDEITCCVQIVRQSDNRKSNIVRFVYTKYDAADATGAKRSRPTDGGAANAQNVMPELDLYVQGIEQSDNQKLVADSNVSPQYSKHADNVSKNSKEFVAEGGNTAYHNAIQNGTFPRIYKKSASLQLQQPMHTAINYQRENPLHYACKLNKFHCIRPLIGLRCSIIAQDTKGRTPLHIAMEYKNNCVGKFRELFDDHEDYPHLTAELRKLFEIYNENGHTVLHLAILNDLRELVEAMLAFSTSVNIYVCAIEALGNGDTILHLAKSSEIIEMINDKLPEACRYENYDGQKADQLPELVELMAQSSIGLPCAIR